MSVHRPGMVDGAVRVPKIRVGQAEPVYGDINLPIGVGELVDSFRAILSDGSGSGGVADLVDRWLESQYYREVLSALGAPRVTQPVARVCEEGFQDLWWQEYVEPSLRQHSRTGRAVPCPLCRLDELTSQIAERDEQMTAALDWQVQVGVTTALIAAAVKLAVLVHDWLVQDAQGVREAGQNQRWTGQSSSGTCLCQSSTFDPGSLLKSVREKLIELVERTPNTESALALHMKGLALVAGEAWDPWTIRGWAYARAAADGSAYSGSLHLAALYELKLVAGGEGGAGSEEGAWSLDRARAYVEQAITIRPHYARYYVTYARILMRLGQVVAARRACAQGLYLMAAQYRRLEQQRAKDLEQRAKDLLEELAKEQLEEQAKELLEQLARELEQQLAKLLEQRAKEESLEELAKEQLEELAKEQLEEQAKELLEQRAKELEELAKEQLEERAKELLEQLAELLEQLAELLEQRAKELEQQANAEAPEAPSVDLGGVLEPEDRERFWDNGGWLDEVAEELSWLRQNGNGQLPSALRKALDKGGAQDYRRNAQDYYRRNAQDYLRKPIAKPFGHFALRRNWVELIAVWGRCLEGESAVGVLRRYVVDSCRAILRAAPEGEPDHEAAGGTGKFQLERALRPLADYFAAEWRAGRASLREFEIELTRLVIGISATNGAGRSDETSLLDRLVEKITVEQDRIAPLIPSDRFESDDRAAWVELVWFSLVVFGIRRRLGDHRRWSEGIDGFVAAHARMSHPWALLVKSQALLEVSQHDLVSRALEFARSAQKLLPHEPAVHHNLAQVLTRRAGLGLGAEVLRPGDTVEDAVRRAYEEACEAVNEAIRLDPEHPQYYLTRARINAQQGNALAATEDLIVTETMARSLERQLNAGAGASSSDAAYYRDIARQAADERMRVPLGAETQRAAQEVRLRAEEVARAANELRRIEELVEHRMAENAADLDRIKGQMIEFVALIGVVVAVLSIAGATATQEGSRLWTVVATFAAVGVIIVLIFVVGIRRMTSPTRSDGSGPSSGRPGGR